jgi:hypothetical protein
LVGIFSGGFILLNACRLHHAEQPSPFAPPTRARLNQLYQLLPARQAAPIGEAEELAEPQLEEDPGWQPLPLQQETGQPSLIKPPRWLIDAGLLPAASGEWPAADQQETSERGEARRDMPNGGRKVPLEAE